MQLKSTFFSKKNLEIILTFETEIAIQNNLEDIYLSIDKEGTQNTKDNGIVEISSVKKSSEFSIQLALKFLKDTVEQSIYIQSSKKGVITAIINSAPFIDFPITVNIKYYDSSLEGATTAAGGGLAGLGILAMPVWYVVSFSTAIGLLKLF